MLSFPLLVIINQTNMKLAARGMKIEGYFICRILYVSLLHLLPFDCKIGRFSGIWRIRTLRVVYYSQIERALNLNNYCQMWVWRSFRTGKSSYIWPNVKKAAAIWMKLGTFCMFSAKKKSKSNICSPQTVFMYLVWQTDNIIHCDYYFQ